jgi:hypothetical protein
VDVILTSLLPLALLVTVGALLLKFRFYDDTVRRSLDLLVYWVCLPAMLTHSLVDAPTDGLREAGMMMLAMAIATLGGTAVAVLLAIVLRLRRSEAGVFAQSAMRGNLAYVGLPVIALAVDGHDATIAKAALVLAPTMFLFNVLGVLLLVGAMRYGDGDSSMSVTGRMIGRSLVTNPLLIASGFGLALWMLHVNPGDILMETLELLAMPAATLALLSLGGAIVIHPIHGKLGLAAVGAALKCGVVPVIAYAGCTLLGITGVDRQIVLVFAATPTAVASNVLATQLGGDESLAAAGIVVSTVASAGSLAVALYLGG